MLIGELVGDVSTDTFTFEAYKEIKKFDFVAVKNPKEGKEWILAQVDSVKKSPEGKTECVAKIIGYREKGMLKQPRHVIKPDSMVYRADEDVIAETLGLTKDGCYMGRLETNPDIRIFVDPTDLYKHIAVLAKTGAGKSYATGVLIEELLEQGYPLVIIDPHGEYHSLAHPNDEISDEDKEKFGIDPKGYNITEYSTETDVNTNAEPLSFSSRNLSAKEIQQIVPHSFTNSQIEVLYNALKDLKKRDQPYSLDDVIDKCMNQDSKAKWNVVNMLEHVQESGMFSENPTNLNQLVRRGHASIVNLRGVDPEDQEMIVYKLSKELFEKRKVGELDPCIMIMEEAHNFVPEANLGKAACSDILRTIASEGRKFGMGIGVISQRPANINKNILSQCNIQLILRVTNSNDLSAIGRSFEGITKEVENSIKSLSPGVGLILGKEYPIMTNIRTRRSKHGGITQQLEPDEAPDTEDVTAEPAPTNTQDNQVQDVDNMVHESEEQVQETAAVAADTTGAAEELPAVDHEEAEQGMEPEPPEPEPAPQEDTEQDTEQPSTAAEAPDDAAEEPEKEEKEAEDTSPNNEEPGITAIAPSISADSLKEEFGSIKKAYYPLWIVSAGEEKIAVDATDGEIKARKKQVSDNEEQILELVKDGDKSRGQILEALDISLSKLERLLGSLQQKSLITENGDKYGYNGVNVFDREFEEIPDGDYTVINTDVPDGKAIKIAKNELSGTPEDIKVIYYPYYTAGKRVFDAVLGQEI